MLVTITRLSIQNTSYELSKITHELKENRSERDSRVDREEMIELCINVLIPRLTKGCEHTMLHFFFSTSSPSSCSCFHSQVYQKSTQKALTFTFIPRVYKNVALSHSGRPKTESFLEPSIHSPHHGLHYCIYKSILQSHIGSKN